MIHFTYHAKDGSTLHHLLMMIIHNKEYAAHIGRSRWSYFRINIYTATLLLASSQIRLRNRVGNNNIAFVRKPVNTPFFILLSKIGRKQYFQKEIAIVPCTKRLRNVRNGKIGPFGHNSYFIVWAQFDIVRWSTCQLF